MGTKLDRTLAVLNGLVGDYLARTSNGLATEMACHHAGLPLELDAEHIAAVHPSASGRVVVLVHGVMCDESVFRFAGGGDYGTLLARDLGFTPFYVRYNSGLAIADAGAELAQLLGRLTSAYPAELQELVLVGYSMGGLLVRRACHVAALRGDAWLGKVARAIYLGTPHLGAPAERLGRSIAQLLQWIDDPYTRLVADVANLRSGGIKDLGDADLRHEDRARERTVFSLGGTAPALRGASLRDAQHPLPLLPSMKHYLIAGSLAIDPRLAVLFGDAIVPLGSATFVTNELLPREQVKVLPGLSHLALAHDPDVYESIKAFCEDG